MMNEVTITTELDSLIMDFNILDDWDAFEDIIKLLANYFGAIITKRVDGAESKFVVLNIDSTELTLINNPYGNTLKASNADAKVKLFEIYDNWNKYSNFS